MTLINEQLKRMLKLMSLNESEVLHDDLIVIGDEFAEYIIGKYEDFGNILIDKNMTVGLLIKRLQTMTEKPEVKNLILSVGANEFFSNIKSVGVLCDLIDEVFPNAEKYVIKGTIDDDKITKEEDILEINEMSVIFYEEFMVNGFEIVGDYSPFSDTPMGDTNPTVIAGKEIVNGLQIEKIDSSIDQEVEIKKSNTYVGAGDDREDFDTIYEFLNRFEESILNTKNTYSLSNDYSPDVEQIQISLKFLDPNSFGDLEIDGLYGNNTESAILQYQKKHNLEETGESDFETNEEIFYDLKVKGFDDEDLGKFLNKEVDKSTWIVDFSNGGFNSQQKSNIELMIQYMEDSGIIDAITQIGILSTIGKECDFTPRNEDCYDGTPNSDIRRIFGDRVSDLNEPELTVLKKNCKAFFNKVYGNINGNEGGDDGYNYRGRGFNGITGKGVYRKYGGIVGENLVGNPELLNNDMEVAAKVAVAFFTNGVTKFPEFETKEDAAAYFANKNAGDASKRSMFAGNAESYSKRFDASPPN